MSASISKSRQRRIAAIARAEVDPSRFDRFEPITKGPVVAVLGLCALGGIAFFYLLVGKTIGLFRRK